MYEMESSNENKSNILVTAIFESEGMDITMDNGMRGMKRRHRGEWEATGEVMSAIEENIEHCMRACNVYHW